jgi:hypothetical protein
MRWECDADKLMDGGILDITFEIYREERSDRSRTGLSMPYAPSANLK